MGMNGDKQAGLKGDSKRYFPEETVSREEASKSLLWYRWRLEARTLRGTTSPCLLLSPVGKEESWYTGGSFPSPFFRDVRLVSSGVLGEYKEKFCNMEVKKR